MLDTKIEGIVYLPCTYRVIVRNAVICCSTFYWFCTYIQIPNGFLVFSLLLPGYNENHHYQKCAFINEQLVNSS